MRSWHYGWFRPLSLPNVRWRLIADSSKSLQKLLERVPGPTRRMLVTTSGLAKISNRCSAGRSAFLPWTWLEQDLAASPPYTLLSASPCWKDPTGKYCARFRVSWPRCPSLALTQLCFINSIACMSTEEYVNRRPPQKTAPKHFHWGTQLLHTHSLQYLIWYWMAKTKILSKQ